MRNIEQTSVGDVYCYHKSALFSLGHVQCYHELFKRPNNLTFKLNTVDPVLGAVELLPPISAANVVLCVVAGSSSMGIFTASE